MQSTILQGNMELAYQEIQQIKSLRLKPKKDLNDLEAITLRVIRWNEQYDQLMKPIEGLSLLSYSLADPTSTQQNLFPPDVDIEKYISPEKVEKLLHLKQRSQEWAKQLA